MYVPQVLSPEFNAQEIYEEFLLISAAITVPQFERINFLMIYAEPDRPRQGDVVLADGTTWNPGSGVGLYVYLSAAWVKL